MPTPIRAPQRDDLGAGPEPARRRTGHGGFGGTLLLAVLACATTVAAVGIGLASLFVTPLLGATVLTLTWPHIFSTEFTQWVFGTATLPFWKAFLVFALAGLIAKIHGWTTSGELWRKK